MNYGAMVGLLSMGFSFIIQTLRMRGGMGAQTLLLSSFLIFIVLGSIHYRKNRNGFMTYGQALGQGVLISFFGSILLAFFTYIFFQFASPESLQEIKDQVEIQMEDQGLTSEQVELAMSVQSKMMTPGIMALMIILTYVFLGTLISLVTSAILKRENPNPFSEN